MSTLASPPAPPRARAAASEEDFDRLVPLVFRAETLLAVLVTFGFWATTQALRALWPPLGDRGEALWTGVAALVGTLLALVSAARLVFEPRWVFAGLPAAILCMPAIADSAASGFLPVLGAYSCGLAIQVARLRRVLAAQPELHLRRIVLAGQARPGRVVTGSMHTRSRRTWLIIGLVAIGGIAVAGVRAALAYRPPLEPSLERLLDAWSARDVERIAALFDDARRDEERARLEHEIAELDLARGWPEPGGWTYDSFPRRRSNSHAYLDGREIDPFAVQIELGRDGDPPSRIVMLNGGGSELHAALSLQTSWYVRDGTWVLRWCHVQHAPPSDGAPQ